MNTEGVFMRNRGKGAVKRMIKAAANLFASVGFIAVFAGGYPSRHAYPFQAMVPYGGRRGATSVVSGDFNGDTS